MCDAAGVPELLNGPWAMCAQGVGHIPDALLVCLSLCFNLHNCLFVVGVASVRLLFINHVDLFKTTPRFCLPVVWQMHDISMTDSCLHNSYLPASERTKWLCISVSAAMTMQNVVNPTFWERKSEYRTDVLPVRPCSRNGYEWCRLKLQRFYHFLYYARTTIPYSVSTNYPD